jgi:hypothetical protein
VRGGWFLTPYGNWNEDHGSPVLLAAFTPYLVAYEYVPNQQMGLELFGSRDLAEGLTLEYAGTLSNGRSPQADYRDLSDNKAVGLRLKLSYQAGDVYARLGAYGYLGSYTDSTETEVVKLTSNLTLDPKANPFIGIIYNTTDAYNEKALTFDAQVRYKGLRLFSEVAIDDIRYTTAPNLSGQAVLFGAPANVTVYGANHRGYACFGLAGYEFGLGKKLWNMKLTPYAGAEIAVPDDTETNENVVAYRFGVNVKPAAFVTAKVEAVRALPQAAALAGDLWLVVSQVAVAF